jgi:hypothetical protein
VSGWLKPKRTQRLVQGLAIQTINIIDMKTFVLLSLLSLFFFESCVPIARLSFGMSRPKEETPQTLKKFLDKNKYPLTDHYLLKDSSEYIRVMNDTVFSKFLFRTVLFTGDFRRIEADTSRCQWSGGYAIEHLKKDSAYSCTDLFSFSKLYTSIRPLFDSIALPDIKQGEFDFIAVNTWARFIGKLNERIFSVDGAVKKRPDLKILVINLNLDMQKVWQLRKDQRIKLN